MAITRETTEARRDGATRRGDLATTLRLDDELEDLGMHGDDRRTCWQCQSWADHAHNPITNRTRSK